MRNPAQAEKDLRAFLKKQSLSLKSLALPQALELMLNFYREIRDYQVLPHEGDALVVYEDVTDHGKGTRLEIGINRLFLLPPSDQESVRKPALRLRLRLCFKWDMDVIKHVLPTGSWSLQCWSPEESATLLEAVQRNGAYQTMAGKTPSEANIILEETSYLPSALRPEPDVKQMWWGVCNVR
jgi:hypothetical protein